MFKKILATSLLSLLSWGCISCQPEEPKSPPPPQGPSALADEIALADTIPNSFDPRDRESSTTTPSKRREESDSDRELTKTIRQALMSDDSISLDGKNIRITSTNGIVTLRGPVANSTEKLEIEKMARQTSGVVLVNNQLEPVVY